MDDENVKKVTECGIEGIGTEECNYSIGWILFPQDGQKRAADLTGSTKNQNRVCRHRAEALSDFNCTVVEESAVEGRVLGSEAGFA